MTKQEGNSAKTQIDTFNRQFAESRNLGGFGEEIAQCSRIVETLVRTDDLNVENLTGIFARAHQNLPASATYLLAYRAIEEASKIGKMNEGLLAVVVDSVLADTDPLWSTLGMQEEQNNRILQQLFLNEALFEMMLPYISPEDKTTQEA